MIKELNNIFKTIADNHLFINEYTTLEDIEVSVVSDYNYPLLVWEQPFIYSNILGSPGGKTYNITLNLMDKALRSEEDYLNVIDKLEHISDGIIILLKEELRIKYPTLTYNNDVNVLFFRQITNDELINCRMEFSVTQKKQLNKCDIPTSL